MAGVVSNATPLIYLAKIGRMDLLKKVFGRVFVPEEVKAEVVDRGKKLGQRDAYVVEKAIEDGWLQVSRAELVEVPIELERGEVAVLSLAKKLGVRAVLIDEVSARTAARLLRLRPRGTIYVLLKALERGDMDLDGLLKALEDLVREGFRLREEIYLKAVRRARAIAAGGSG